MDLTRVIISLGSILVLLLAVGWALSYYKRRRLSPDAAAVHTVGNLDNSGDVSVTPPLDQDIRDALEWASIIHDNRLNYEIPENNTYNQDANTVHEYLDSIEEATRQLTVFKLWFSSLNASEQLPDILLNERNNILQVLHVLGRNNAFCLNALRFLMLHPDENEGHYLYTMYDYNAMLDDFDELVQELMYHWVFTRIIFIPILEGVIDWFAVNTWKNEDGSDDINQYLRDLEHHTVTRNLNALRAVYNLLLSGDVKTQEFTVAVSQLNPHAQVDMDLTRLISFHDRAMGVANMRTGAERDLLRRQVHEATDRSVEVRRLVRQVISSETNR